MVVSERVSPEETAMRDVIVGLIWLVILAAVAHSVRGSGRAPGSLA
jgi:hypothetical protein